MKPWGYIRILLFVIMFNLLSSFSYNKEKAGFRFPWKNAGLTERQAAAHLLSRFTFGAKPGDVDKVVEMGLEKWFLQQLDGGLPDNGLRNRLKDYDALNLTNAEVLAKYPFNGQVFKMAVAEGAISKDSLNISDDKNKKEYKAVLLPYMEKKGLKPESELQRQFVNQKILRAAYSDNQLTEVLTDFWFNHFNVSVTKKDCRHFIPSYERDVIRKHITGKFEDLLLATAKSPAMLFYLDNFTSSGTNTEFNSIENNERLQKRLSKKIADADPVTAKFFEKIKENKKNQGLNENYAREVMELHTMGVDGGYTQQDVTQAARVLTGWTVYPMADYGPGSQLKKIIEKIGEDKLIEKGFVHEGDFLFAANRHDNGEKIVLGKTYHSSNGYSEGIDLLKTLANNSSTAVFICRKLAVRFVSDNPPATLTGKMAKTFLDKKGDIKEVIITMVSSPEFWSNDALRQKTKSPFELAISAVRSLNAEIEKPYPLYNAINKMGQKIYAYQAPTGFPDKGQYWINTGALLNRMNFGLAIAARRINGIHVDLLALNNGHEPESAEAALTVYSNILLTERNAGETIKRLTPLLNDPELEARVRSAAAKADNNAMNTNMSGSDDEMSMSGNENTYVKKQKNNAAVVTDDHVGGKNMMSQVVGIIIGSPEFQRR